MCMYKRVKSRNKDRCKRAFIATKIGWLVAFLFLVRYDVVNASLACKRHSSWCKTQARSRTSGVRFRIRKWPCQPFFSHWSVTRYWVLFLQCSGLSSPLDHNTKHPSSSPFLANLPMRTSWQSGSINSFVLCKKDRGWIQRWFEKKKYFKINNKFGLV